MAYMHLFKRYSPLSTIRGQIFLAFAVMSGLTAAIGGYEVVATSAARRVVINTYDRPLMSINFARAASLAFSQMENELLKTQVSGNDKHDVAKFEDLTQNLFEDLAVAKQRAMSPEAVGVAQNVRELAQRWVGTATMKAEKQDSAAAHSELANLSNEIIEELDKLIELTAEDGFHERQRSLAELSRVTSTSLAYSGFAVLL